MRTGSASRRGVATLALLMSSAVLRADAQSATRLTGLVHDSLTGFPLSGAVVQVVTRDAAAGVQTTLTDRSGRFLFDSLAPGHYQVGFHHPRLDTLGIEAPVRPVVLTADVPDLLLSVPSAVHIRAAVCGPGTDGREATLLMGIVYDGRTGAEVPNATVTVDWTEWDVGARTTSPRQERRTVTSGANGWYGVCDVPREGVVRVAAHTAQDSTDRVELRLFGDALNHRPLYVGAAVTTRLTGRVRRDGTGRPLVDATVAVPNGPSVRTDARGEFVLDSVQVGTRTLDVRAMGFYPERLAVNAIADAPRVEAALRSFGSVLDTVKVLANYERYSLRRELEQRRRMGIGRVITERDIARRQPIRLSDALWAMPGVYVTRGLGVDQHVTMRGIFSPRCRPSLFLNGFALFIGDMGSAPFGFSDLDTMVNPADVLAIEVYAAGHVPPPFAVGMTGCGAIGVWTR